MINIAKPFIGEEEKSAVMAVLNSGQISPGKKVEEFEQRFAFYINAKHAIATSSGTTALKTLLMGYKIKHGDEVIVPTLTFGATASPILFCGARPVFSDVDAETFNISAQSIQEKITPKTKAIIPVHLYGLPCDMKAIHEIAHEKNITIIEDACQAHGAEHFGKKVGSENSAAFSLYATKNITTGEGGLITTNDDIVAERCRLARNHGQSTRYNYVELGYNFRMTNIHAAIGIEQLKKLDLFNDARARNAKFLSENLPKSVRLQKVNAGLKHVYHLFSLCINNRDRALKILNEAGIESNAYYPVPVHKTELYKKLGCETSLPNAEKICGEILSLPVHPAVTDEDLSYIVEVMKSICA
ncbi:MAG: DegT/DnrJ/EryC1/StrS family aminotransferase [DPANN group archaeon]|nr:DegT/DnrJ/EryC1/StrS family aminotransferase [DPANN group archaeon]